MSKTLKVGRFLLRRIKPEMTSERMKALLSPPRNLDKKPRNIRELCEAFRSESIGVFSWTRFHGSYITTPYGHKILIASHPVRIKDKTIKEWVHLAREEIEKYMKTDPKLCGVDKPHKLYPYGSECISYDKQENPWLRVYCAGCRFKGHVNLRNAMAQNAVREPEHIREIRTRFL